jgi:hypothetical protein
MSNFYIYPQNLLDEPKDKGSPLCNLLHNLRICKRINAKKFVAMVTWSCLILELSPHCYIIHIYATYTYM